VAPNLTCWSTVAQSCRHATGVWTTCDVYSSRWEPGRKMHQLLKLRPFDGSRSPDTFLLKFQRMASYLCWNEEDALNQLCGSLEGVAGQVLWDVGPRATTADIICLFQTRFGMQLQAEHFKAKLQARQRAPGESLQSLYQDTCRLMTSMSIC